MTKLTVKTPLDFDLLAFYQQFQVLRDPFDDARKVDADTYEITLSDRFTLVVDGQFNAAQTKGPIDTITILDGGAPVLEIADTGLSVAKLDVVGRTGGIGLLSLALSEGGQIFGGTGDDQLVSFAPSRLYGGRGDDTFIDQLDQVNHYDGESGIDTVVYLDNNTTQFGVTVSLADPSLNREEAEGDTYRSIENVIGTSWDDLIYGSKVKNGLAGRGGDDTLAGGAKGDMLSGGKGFDYASYETADFRDGAFVVVANLADRTQNLGDAKGDVYSSIEGLIGSNFDDMLVGDRHDNVIFGLFGGDVIDGGRGNDTLWGDGTEFGFDGDDTFMLNATNNGVKTIMDFDVFDKIMFDRAGFGLKASYKLIDGKTFVSADDPQATGKLKTFLYDRTSGELFFDNDGRGAGEAELLAVVKFHNQQYLDINDVVLG